MFWGGVFVGDTEYLLLVHVRQDMLIGCSLEMITPVSSGKVKQALPSLFFFCDEQGNW